MDSYKVCHHCYQSKDISAFRQCKYPSNKLYYKSICKKCESSQQIKRIQQFGRSKVQKEKARIYKKTWKIKNRDRENAKYRLKLHSDPIFKLRKNISRSIQHMIKASKFSSVLNFLNYTIAELKAHLEKQFTPLMNWGNYGIFWHIDHIIPHSCLPYIKMDEDNFKKCWALKNLRPLEAKQNMLDGSTRIRHKSNHILTEKLNG